MIWAWDVPAVPGAVDANGEEMESSRAELEAFFDLVAEVIGEQGEPRPRVLRNIVQLEREYLGNQDGAPSC
jgi:predicted RNase H-like HicB family nuclease